MRQHLGATTSMFLRLVYTQAAAPPSPLKVLALHGYSQCGMVFRDRSGGFRKPLKKRHFQFIYPDAPFGCTAKGEDEAEADADDSRRAWWRGHSGLDTYDGWDESREKLRRLWEEEQCEGIVGFSQGAAAAAMLCADLCSDPAARKPKFAIIVAGFVPRDQNAAASLLAGVAGVPTLHVWGKQDDLVIPERSKALSDLFTDAVTCEHEGGHTTPTRVGRLHVST